MLVGKDLYFVALKVFLEDKKGNFLIIKDKFGDWDIPGGRLRENDFTTSFPEIIARKMQEELGENVKYELGDPIVFMRHQRDEVLPSGQKEPRRIFAVGYRAKYLGGEIKFGYNHEQFEWVSIVDFKPEDYFVGGWLQGVKEYQKIIKAKNPPLK